MPRRPGRPAEELLAPRVPWQERVTDVAMSLFSPPLAAPSEVLGRLDAATYVGIITALMAELPEPKRAQIRAHLKTFLQHYDRKAAKNSEPDVACLQAILALRGVEERDCDPRVLLRHKADALDVLAHLPRARNPAHRLLALRKRLPNLVTVLADVACPCGKSGTTPPFLLVTRWAQASPAKLIVDVLAYHHGLKPSTMRRKLASAPRDIRDAMRALRPLWRAIAPLVKSSNKGGRRHPGRPGS